MNIGNSDSNSSDNAIDPYAAPLGPGWAVVLLGSRTLLGKLHGALLSPGYQLEMRATPVQVNTPEGPKMGMTRSRYIAGIGDFDGFAPVIIPLGSVIVKEVTELPASAQEELRQLVSNYETAVAANRRKARIATEAEAMSKMPSFGGGARKE
jgi:hypothetical protein